MKKIIALCLLSFAFVYAENGDSDQITGDISIRFYDRRIYYPGNAASEPMFVKFSITNTGPNTLHFKLADDHIFSLDFIVLDTKNRPLKHTDYWLRKRAGNRHIYFREISLEPGESYAFIENIKDYIEFKHPGMYLLSAVFFPQLKRLADTSEPHITSNNITLEVKPAPAAAALGAIPVSEETGGVLIPRPLPPDQIIMYTLTARQKSRWEQFFLYMDLQKMLTRNPARNKRFKAESETGRLSMVDTYKRELQQERTDKDISTIPVDFEVERTTYNATQAEVTVIEWFAYRNFKEKKRFTYYLLSQNGIWYIYDYVVENLGTE